MIILGLTGSIGMGKSTIANLMRHLGIPVHDSDATIQGLLQPQSHAYPLILKHFPPRTYPHIYDKKIKAHHRINRAALGALIFENDALRQTLEGILHPLNKQSQEEFLRLHRANRAKFVCLDIPLLFETNAQERVDYTIVVTAPPFVQRARVLSRPNMNSQKFEAVFKRQMPDAQKRHKADFILPTCLSLAQSMRHLKKILYDIENPPHKSETESDNEQGNEILNDPRNSPRYRNDRHGSP